jgi:hypothetical protein
VAGALGVSTRVSLSVEGRLGALWTGGATTVAESKGRAVYT